MGAEDPRESLPIENVLIIGSGPAGYTAAIYAARANLQPLLITGFSRGGIPGGQLMTTTHVENFPGFPNGVLGPDLMDLFKAQALRWGTHFLEADAESIDLSSHPFVVKANGDFYKTNTLIIATGASANRLGVPHEDVFWSKGISACAICDGATPQFRSEELAVVGGGDSACEEAVYLTKYGSHVHLLVRSDRLRASAAMADRVIANHEITVHWNTDVVDVEGSEWLSAIRLKSSNSSNERLLPVKGLFYAIGHTPNTDLIKNQLECDLNGYLLTRPGRPETSLEGVFAAGDVADSEWRQGITAASSGCKAALAAERWLSHKGLAKRVIRKSVEPESAESPEASHATSPPEFDPNGLWQLGSYALRKLYHESEKPLLVVYSSPSCGPCHVLKPQLKRLISEFDGAVQGVEINIEVDEAIASQAGITGTPTVQLFKLKALKKQWQGVKQRSEFREEINHHI